MIVIKDKDEFCKAVEDMHNELDASAYEAVEAVLNSLTSQPEKEKPEGYEWINANEITWRKVMQFVEEQESNDVGDLITWLEKEKT